MRVFAECMACMIRQVEKGLRILEPEIDELEIVKAQKQMMKLITTFDLETTNNVVLGGKTYAIIAEVLQTKDPYKELKHKYNQIALDLYPEVKELVKNADQPLVMAVKASIMGNAIDFGAADDINIHKELESLAENNLGGKQNIQKFTDIIKESKKIMILGDNSGEIVFDKIFIEELQELYPSKEIIYSVRGGPIINDVTMEDAKFVGMTEICEVVEASSTPGIYLKECSNSFNEHFNTADLILSKGQGNFEAMIDINAEWATIFFLLKAKCILMSKIFNVPQGTLILVEKDKNLVDKVGKRKW
ncbi:MAG: DUF89 family protein [Candidatus Lokiarchaeota archaeon]|nr:DUF89 family protein [Candidatus Lokiarchaeota archaeon]